MTGQLNVPGAPHEHSSHRSEIAGLVAILICYWTICSHYGIKEGTITIGCDGQAALKALEDLVNPQPSKKDYDYRVEGRAILQKLKDRGITIQFRWVKGHQDDKQETNPASSRILQPRFLQGTNLYHGCLDRWAILNCEMDASLQNHTGDNTITSTAPIHPSHTRS